MPSRRFGAAPPKAKTPPKVLNETNPLALSFTSMPFWLLPEITLPSGITPPTWVFCDVPETSRPSPPLATIVRVVGPGTHEVGMDGRVVRVGDPQAVAADCR